MSYHYKIFLWKNGEKSTEYTDFLTFPIFYEDKLNEELDSGEIILDMMPISTKKAFPPKTKFRLERYKTEDCSDIPKVWDLVVEHDDPEEYIGTIKYCNHRMNMQEPSVIAQNMHVDNIALTYELQDVTTNYKTYSSDATKVEPNIQNGGSSYKLRLTKYDDKTDSATTGSTKSRYGYFKNSYAYLWDEEELKTIKSLKLNVEISQEQTISFKVPKLFCYGTTDGQDWDKKLFEVNTITRIFRYETKNGKINEATKTLILSKENGPTSITPADNEWYYSDGATASLRIIDETTVESNGYTVRPSTSTTFESLYLTAPVIAQVGNYTDNIVSLTLESLSEAEIENNKGYYYLIDITANPINKDGMLTRYETTFYALYSLMVSYPYTTIMLGRFIDHVQELADSNNINIKVGLNAKDMSQTSESGYMIMKGVKYSCFDLFRKALLTVDTQIINNNQIGIDDIEYPIILDPAWENRLKISKVQETILETKNLWEVFLQIGYYLHAIPYLHFAEDGTDRFVLSFKQLGGMTKKQDTSDKITIFNSRNLNDYFTQFDSYVTNIFSPQNLIDEWLVVKTNDSSSLVSNNTAVLKTSYGISEIVEFDITYDGSVGGSAGTKSALSHIFEKSIYQILTADYNISPGMGDSLFYELGGNQIDGLTYIPPSVNGDMPMALKRIVGKLFSNVSISQLKFNNLKFHIKYRTQDSMRISQVRPDIQDFLKNSSYEKYPHHEQFFGQQDKIVDSERFSLNLFGHLVRIGNNIYQCQEKVEEDADEKESGDLVEIDGEPYYVTDVENECYPDATFQKVTYSKNYNQLSYIVTIPSEPRFYEVSERSKIRREIRLFDFFKISTTSNKKPKSPRFLSANKWCSFLKDIIFNKNGQGAKLPNYAWTRFMADKKRAHRGAYSQYIPLEQMFPSSELDRTNPNQIMPKSSSDHADVIVPVLHFPMKDGIQFEWDMEDNFKAGDSIDTSISGKNNTTDEAYYALQSVRYCDLMGRADLFTFRLFNKTNWTYKQAQDLPKACIEPTETESIIYLPSPYSAALDKDCRCAISYNYQISMLYDSEFVTFSNLFGQKEGELYCCLLDKEISMFNENTSVIPATVLADKIPYSLIEDYTHEQLEIRITKPNNIDARQVKSIVFYEIDKENNKVSYLAKNFRENLEGSLPSFYLYPVFNE